MAMQQASEKISKFAPQSRRLLTADDKREAEQHLQERTAERLIFEFSSYGQPLQLNPADIKRQILVDVRQPHPMSVRAVVRLSGELGSLYANVTGSANVGASIHYKQIEASSLSRLVSAFQKSLAH